MLPACDDFFHEVDAAPVASPERVNAAVRSYLDAARAYLLELHDAGEPSRYVNATHADVVDRLVRKLFRVTEDRYFRESPRLRGFRLAVIAVGSYGRRTPCLGSDIDLLFLYRGKINPYIETLTEAITYRLWDARLVVGAAVRTVQECVRIGLEDLATLTSYLDARFLCGDAGLSAELDRVTRDWMRRDAGGFMRAKLEEQRLRHERHGESLFLLQPNVREGVGGLRDYQTALWVARAIQWSVYDPEQLLAQGFIDEPEFRGLIGALDFIWRIRNELHRDGRKEDRLHFAAQERLARRLGFQPTAHSHEVEELMRRYYGHARTIAHASKRIVDHALLLEERHRGGVASASHPVEEGFAILEGRLEIPHASLLHERPVRVLSAFAVAQRHDVEFSVRTQRLLQQHTHLIDDDVRNDPEAAVIFRRILSAPHRVYRTLVAMNELDVLGAYLPEFGTIVGLWQQDMYHTYTVDVHSLFLVEQLRRLQRGLFSEELPLATELMKEEPSPLVLFLGCILHDIGKGKGGGHPERGARRVPEICQRLGLGEEETEAVRFLVLHHLTLSGMAERRDVHEFRLILTLANLVETRARLRNLYLLTVADIRSVSRDAWTTWKAGLLETLYRNTAEWLEAGVEDESAPGFFLQRAADRVRYVEAVAFQRLAEAGVPVERARALLESMPRRYLLSHGPVEIAQHLQAALEYIESGSTARVTTFTPEAGEDVFTGLVVFAADRPGLLATMAGVLTACGHDILAAQVYTTRARLAVEIFQIAPLAGGGVERERERLRLEERLIGVLERDETLTLPAEVRARRLPVLRARPPRIQITNDESDFFTIIDITAVDRPGLLHDISRVLAGLGVDVSMSRISTRVTQVTDSFYVTDRGQRILDATRQKEIESALLAAIQQSEP